MNRRCNHRKNTDGSALLAALLIATVFIVLAAQVLRNVRFQASSARQNLAWSEAYLTAQSGLGIAMARLNEEKKDGFTLVNPSRRIGEGSDLSEVRVTIESLSGYGSEVYRVRASGRQGLSALAQSGVNAVDLTADTSRLREFYFKKMDGTTLTNAVARRTLEAIVMKESAAGPRFAVRVKDWLRLQQATGLTDSFNSADPNYSKSMTIDGKLVTGLYDASKHLNNGDVGLTTTSGGNVELYGKIYGDIFTNGVTKGLLPVDAARSDSQKNNGYVNTTGTLDVTFKEDPANVETPTWAAGTYQERLWDLQNGDQTLTAGSVGSPTRYHFQEWAKKARLTLPSGQTKGEIEIWVEGNINLNGSDALVVDSGVTAKIYFQNGLNAGGSTTVINNKNYNASSLQFNGYRAYSGSGAININAATGSQFYAVVYAPLHDFSIGGTADWMGAITAKSLVANGTVKIHYDEALGKGGSGKGGWRMVSMIEMLQ